MANGVNTVKDAGAIISKAAAGFFEDKCQFIKSIDKEDMSTFEGKNGYQSGDTIQISKPARFEMNTGADISASIQDVTEEKVALTLDKQRNVAVNFSSAEITTDFALKAWLNRVVKPAVERLAEGVEAECLVLAKNSVSNIAGTAGSSTFDTDMMLEAGEILDYNLAHGDRYALLNPSANRKAVNSRKSLFNHTEEVGKQYKKGYMGYADGFEFMRNNLLATHTNGSMGATPLVRGAGQNGNTLIIDGITGTNTVTAGTTFTLDGVFMVHPITKDVTTQLQSFVVTADAAAVGGTATLSIYPAITATGTTQTVDALPADDAPVMFVGAADTGYVQNLAYEKSAFRFVSAPLIKPDGLDMVGQETKGGVTIRTLRDYDVKTDQLIMRFDVLYGFTAVRPEWACRLTA